MDDLDEAGVSAQGVTRMASTSDVSSTDCHRAKDRATHEVGRTTRMHHGAIEFRGMYRYPDLDNLELALSEARELIDDEELADLEPDWLRSFVRAGTTLRVTAMLPVEADRYLAAAVLEVLARPAIEGVVEASRDGKRLDWFPSRAELPSRHMATARASQATRTVEV
jgi:hypothetical protein